MTEPDITRALWSDQRPTFDVPVERLRLAYIVYGKDMRVLDWNPAAEHIFGYAKSETIGKSLLSLILPVPTTDCLQDVLRLKFIVDLKSHSVNENLTKDRRIITCEWYNIRVLDTNDKLSKVVALVQNRANCAHVENRIRGRFPGADLFGKARRLAEVEAIRVDRLNAERTDRESLIRLTTRQSEVLQLVVEGFRTKQIAIKLEISIKTVEMHRSHTMDALEIHDIPGLVRYAIRAGLTSAEWNPAVEPTTT